MISGGASGLDRAAAEHLVKRGGRVLITDMNPEGKAVAAALGKNASFFAADCTSEEQVSAALDHAESHFGEPISAAVNTAGIAFAAKTLNKKGVPHKLDVYEKVLKVNVVGSFNVCRLAAQRIATRDPDEDGGRGVLVNTASIAAFDGQIGQVAYSSSKGAIVGLTLPLARDLSDVGIRVCTIAPGIFATPMMAAAPEAVASSLAAAIPHPKRFGKPEEYGMLIEQIITNGYLNGEVIRLDGAVRMKP